MFLFSKRIKNSNNLSLEEIQILINKTSDYKAKLSKTSNSWQKITVKQKPLNHSLSIIYNEIKIKTTPPFWWHIYLIISTLIFSYFSLLTLNLSIEKLPVYSIIIYIFLMIFSELLFFNNKIREFSNTISIILNT